MNWNKRVRSERRKSHFQGPRFQNIPEEDTPGPPYKCEVLCMHQSAQELDPPLVLGEKIIPLLTVKDLGMTLDSSLIYDKHIVDTVSNCITELCQINRVKHIFDKHTLSLIINALVFSKMYYCSSVWSNTSKKNISKLQSVQNFAAALLLELENITM